MVIKMKIAGLQKMTTVDYPGEIACTIFLHGCNFRCGFCHNPDLVVGNFIEGFSEDKVLEFLKKRIGKLDAVCITGGEPLMSLDFDFIRKIKELGYKVKIDTNGSFPNRLREVMDLDLVDYIAMDIKSCRENYSKVAGVEVDLEKIEESIRIIYEFRKYEFRTTVIGRYHNVLEIKKMGQWLNEICKGKPKNFILQGFKKNKDGMIDSSFLQEDDVSEGILEEMKENVEEYFGEVGIRD